MPKKSTESVCGPVGPTSTVRMCMTRTSPPIAAKVTSTEEICKIFRDRRVGHADRESFYALHLDGRNNVVAAEEVARGTVSSVEVSPREVFKGAILSNASKVIVAHNHPSGDPTPSPDDIVLTRHLVNAGRMIGIAVLDHVIVAGDQCVSMNDTHVIPSGFGGAAPLGKRRK